MVEPNGTSGTVTKQVTALGLSKATQEFLTLHYFAIDSAEWWERILKELLPNARFPGAVVRRAVAVKVFDNCHITPSHRRYPHPLWVDSFCLIADLLLGCGVGRYLESLQGPAFQQEVALRTFRPTSGLACTVGSIVFSAISCNRMSRHASAPQGQPFTQPFFLPFKILRATHTS